MKMLKYSLHNRPLKKRRRRKENKYLLLLSNQVVIIGSEWFVMKQWAEKHGRKRIIEMLPTGSRVNNQTTVLTKLLESLEGDRKTLKTLLQ
jgi:hypothetical protein